MLLQAALDFTDFDNLISAARDSIEGGMNILEVGTPAITTFGISIISKIHNMFPKTNIYADIKSIDFTSTEIEPAFLKGAKFCSVMIFASNENISDALKIARKYNKKVIVSSMGYPIEKLKDRIYEVAQIGVKHILAHGSGKERKIAFNDMIERAKIIRNFDDIKLSVGGGIGRENIHLLNNLNPYIIIVGRGLFQTKNIQYESILLRKYYGQDKVI